MPIPTEPIGSIPRPPRLIKAARDLELCDIGVSDYDAILDDTLRETIEQFETTGSR